MESIKDLKDKCRKVNRREPWYIRNVIRNVSIYFTRFFLVSPLSANQVTMIMISISIICGIFLGLGGYANRLIGAIFLQLILIFDCVDGEIARYRKSKSVKGKFLDLLANSIIVLSIFLGLGIGLLRKQDIFTWPDHIIVICGITTVIFPLLYTAVNYFVSYAGVSSEALSREVVKSEPIKLLKRLLLFFNDQLHIVNIITIAVILNISSLTLLMYGIFFPLWWLASTIAMYRKI